MAPGAPPELLWEGRSPPVDVTAEPGRPRPEATCAVAPGGTLLLYTDGLVERRTEPLTDGLDRLLAQADAHRDEPPAAFVPALVHALRDTEAADDVCVLAARLAG